MDNYPIYEKPLIFDIDPNVIQYEKQKRSVIMESFDNGYHQKRDKEITVMTGNWYYSSNDIPDDISDMCMNDISNYDSSAE